MTLPELSTILARVARHSPARRSEGSGFQAATALVIGEGPEPHMLVIRRASRDGDPWSGHAALPGGKREDHDVDLLATARREAAEEVGLRLDEPVGRLDDVGGRTHPGRVATFVFHVEGTPPPDPDPAEVARALWVPVRVLVDPASRRRHPHRVLGPWPAWGYGDLVIWGLTHRILSTFRDVAGLTGITTAPVEEDSA